MEKIEKELLEIEQKFEVSEIKLNLPNGGFIAGKFWGNKSLRPILCLHGWQDNAATFDTLIPLLSQKFSYLAIDLPGHGKSSHLPDDAIYHLLSYLDIIHHLKKEYNWKKISIIGHSVSSRLAFVYAAIYPENVDMIIGLDNLKPIVYNKERFSTMFKMWIQSYDLMYSRMTDHSPEYSMNEMVKRSIMGSRESLNEKSALVLLRRNIVPAKRNPRKFSFARDGKLRNALFPSFSDDFSFHMADRIATASIPYLFITGSDTPEFDSEESVDATIKIMKKNPKFQYIIIQSGSHHFHLTEPQKISKVVNNFIEKNHHADTLNHL